MTADEEPKVGSKRSRDESGDDDAEKKAAKEEETKVTDDAAGKEAEPGKNDEGSDKKPDGETVKDDKPSTFGSASAGGGFGGFGGFGTSSTGGGFGGFSAGAGGGFGGFARAASTEGGFPALSSVFGDANKPVQLFGKPAADAGDEDGDEGDEDAEGATDTYYKPVVKLQEEDVKTGEEEEECIFASEGALYEFVAEEGKGSTWKERGRGEMRINLGKNGGARMVMRAKGNFRLILNAAMWKDMTFSKMEGGKGVSFPCKNVVSGSDAKVSTFALKMRVSATNVVQQVDAFMSATQKALDAMAQEDTKRQED